MAHYNMNLIGKAIGFGYEPKMNNTKKHELTKIANVWKKHNWSRLQFKLVFETFIMSQAFKINKNQVSQVYW